MIRLCILAFLFFHGFAAYSAPSEEQLEDVSRSKAWLRTMHYLPRWGGYESQLDGQSFFFAKDGKRNPKAELIASLAAFDQDVKIGRLNLHPQCAFPFRFQFIKEALHLDIKAVPCPKFDEFVAMYKGATGVTLVYSSAYPNNPASMFGHTFLRIGSRHENPLLDMGINFAAYTPRDPNFLEFMYRGVTGSYPGSWSMEHYFKKVNEYVNSESRDIWEYELNFTPDETKKLLAHIWELEVTSFFEYYFFDENCSYQIMRAIEAVKLDWNVSQHNIYVIPGETVKRVMDIPGAVRDVKLRLSLYHQLLRRYHSLDSAGRSRLRELMNGKNLEPRNDSPDVLDGALLSQLYKRAKKKAKWSDADQDLENRILSLRAKSPGEAMPLPQTKIELRTRPDLGHDPYSLNLSTGWLDNERGEGMMARFKMRSAYHDLLDSDQGYSSFSEIEFPWIEFQYHENQFRLQELGFVSTTSLFPMTVVDQRLSWRMKFALETERGHECQECLLQTFETAAGAAVGSDRFRLYTFALGRAEGSSRLRHGYRLRPGAEVGFVLSALDSKYKAKIVGRSLWNTATSDQERNYDVALEHSLALGRNQEIRQATILNYSDEWSEASWIEARVQWIQYFR